MKKFNDVRITKVRRRLSKVPNWSVSFAFELHLVTDTSNLCLFLFVLLFHLVLGTVLLCDTPIGLQLYVH